MDSSLLVIIIVVVLGVVIYMFFKKRKNGGNSSLSTEAKKRHDGNEVWKAVKDFLKSQNEKGKEIVETYVAKRPSPDYIDASLPKEEQKKKKLEIKNRKKEEKLKKKQDRAIGKRPRNEPPKEYYVILFVTRNAKTKVEDKPRAIECEVINNQEGRKKKDRKIVINGEKDYETEAKWILPIKEAEEKKAKKNYEAQQKWNRINPFRRFKTPKSGTENLTPEQIEKIKAKEAKKEAKQREKMQKEKEKWEKKETVVKSKK